jgi:hypothetical protein
MRAPKHSMPQTNSTGGTSDSIIVIILRVAIGRHQEYFTSAMAAHGAGPSSRNVVGSTARTSEQLQDPRKQACRGGWREAATHAHWRGSSLYHPIHQNL